MNVTRVGYRHNDVYTAYLDLGSPPGMPEQPAHLSDEVLAKLRTKCTGQPDVRVLTLGPDEPVSLDLPLNQNDVYLVTIQ